VVKVAALAGLEAADEENAGVGKAA